MTYPERDFLILKNIKAITDHAVKQWISIVEQAIVEKDDFTVALSGGKTPINFYQKLSHYKKLPWDKTHVFMVDERYVPYVHEENNFRMINENLLINVNIPAKNIHPIMTSDPSAADSALKYEDDLISFFGLSRGEMPFFDLIILGIGVDGHTASIFPDTQTVVETNHLALAVTPSEASRKNRITITLPVINNAKNIIFLATGINKSKVIHQVIANGDETLPAGMVKPKKCRPVFLLDEDAGSKL